MGMADEIDRLESERDAANTAADLAAQAVGNIAEKCSTLLAERDRLRAVAEAAREVLVAIDSTTPGRLFAGVEGRPAVALLRVALDASAEATDG